MTPLKQKTIAAIIAREGGYTNDASDSGGETKYGITTFVARAEGYKGAMKDLPYDTAFAIYAKKYWDALSLDAIEAISGQVAEELADTAVNMGPGTAGKFLQRALNVFNQQDTDYPDVTVDGVIGPGTVAAFKLYFRKRGPEGVIVMLRALNSQQGMKYIELAEARSKDEKYVYGWFLQRVH